MTRRQPLGATVWGLTFTSLVALSLGVSRTEAQIGVSSGVAQVALIARASPKASVQAVSESREFNRSGNLRSAVVSVRFSANSGHRLVVRRTHPRQGSRVWVRGLDGKYHEVVAGPGVTVARGRYSATHLEREVSYRFKSAGGETSLDLPVRYEILVDPEL